MKPWKRIEPTKSVKIGFRTVVTKTFIMPDGHTVTWDLFWPEGQQFAFVIPITTNGQVVIGRQFRPGPELIMEEVPGGFVDPGEDKEAAVRRELLEETGYQAGDLQYLGTTHRDTYMNAEWHAFLATDCQHDPAAPVHHEPDEAVETDLISIDQLIDNAKHDRMTDGIGVLMAYDELLKLKEKYDVQSTN